MTRRTAPGLAFLAGTLLLAGCATPETRLRNALVDIGLSEPLAACMADHMVDRLSLAQLYRLGDLKRAGRAQTVDDLLHRVRSLEDPEIWAVTTHAAAHCATGV